MPSWRITHAASHHHRAGRRSSGSISTTLSHPPSSSPLAPNPDFSPQRHRDHREDRKIHLQRESGRQDPSSRRPLGLTRRRSSLCPLCLCGERISVISRFDFITVVRIAGYPLSELPVEEKVPEGRMRGSSHPPRPAQPNREALRPDSGRRRSDPVGVGWKAWPTSGAHRVRVRRAGWSGNGPLRPLRPLPGRRVRSVALIDACVPVCGSHRPATSERRGCP
jgi:hypothetical protein